MREFLPSNLDTELFGEVTSIFHPRGFGKLNSRLYQEGISVPAMEQITAQLKDFLQYIALQFIKEPKLAELRIGHSGDNKVNFRLVLTQPDVAILIGRQGFTASTIRSMLKAAAERENVSVNLRIHSHDEERQYTAALEAKETE